jgi:phytoene dehydrogenase-like protein
MILGGGISGLYSAYTLLQENPVQKIIVLEKNDRWGGRIYTDKRLNVECGGARFNREHKTLTRLLQELDLIPDVVSIPDNMKIAESPDTPLSSLLWKLGVYNKLDYAHDLTKYTMEEYMRIVLSKEEVQQLKDSIGYYAEIVVMNAKDAIHLLQHMNQPFFRLEHGLSQVIEELIRRLKLYPSCILKLNQDVRSVQRTDKGYRIATQNQVYYAPWCICTLEKNLVKKFSLGIHHLNKLINGPLCRIFCTFKEPWFKDMPKYTSKTPLRIIIPHDTCYKSLIPTTSLLSFGIKFTPRTEYLV